jgi:hypothetical protein
MTSSHIAALYFDGKEEATKKRLQKLKKASLIGERKRRVNEPSILFLTRSAVRLLQREGTLSSFPMRSMTSWEKRVPVSDFTLRHELEVMDVKAAVHTAVSKNSRLRIEEFSTWPALYQFTVSRAGASIPSVSVKPDGFIRIHETEEDGISEHSFFLEVDRSTEPQTTLASRAASYAEYYQSGDFALKQGGTRQEYKDYPFRVLIILKNAERRNNTAERLLLNNPPIFTQALLTTFAEAKNDPFGKIWIQPFDYREVTRGTPFDPEHRRTTPEYRRRTEREILVEGRIKKHGLLDS